MKNVAIIILFLGALVGCENESVNSQSGVGSTINLSGNWQGSLQSSNSLIGRVGITLNISQRDKITIENQQEGRQILEGVISFNATNCYAGGTVNTDTSRIDGRDARLEFNLNGAGPLVFQGVVTGNQISGNFTSEVSCTFLSPIVTTETTEIMEGDMGDSSTTTIETTGGEPETEIYIDQGPMTITRT